MITIVSFEGVSPKDKKTKRPVTTVQAIMHNGRRIGVCDVRKGGGANMFYPIAESLEDEIRAALDERDGEQIDRQVLLSPDDPRRKSQ